MKKFLLGLAIVAGLAGGLLGVAPASAATDCTKNPTATGCPCDPSGPGKDSAICKDLDPKTGATRFNNTVQNIINTVLIIIGFVAVIMIVVSAIRFTMSHGDSNAATKARQTLIYSVAGLVIAISAFAIVNFVIAQLDGGSGGGSETTTCATGQKLVDGRCVPI